MVINDGHEFHTPIDNAQRGCGRQRQSKAHTYHIHEVFSADLMNRHLCRVAQRRHMTREHAFDFRSVSVCSHHKQLIAERTPGRSEEHTSELQSLMRISYAVFCLKKKQHTDTQHNITLN